MRFLGWVGAAVVMVAGAVHAEEQKPLLVVVVDVVGEANVSPEALRASIAAELGVTVVTPSEAQGRSTVGALFISVHAGKAGLVFHPREGAPTARAVTLPAITKDAEDTVTLIAGNLVRDQIGIQLEGKVTISSPPSPSPSPSPSPNASTPMPPPAPTTPTTPPTTPTPTMTPTKDAIPPKPSAEPTLTTTALFGQSSGMGASLADATGPLLEAQIAHRQGSLLFGVLASTVFGSARTDAGRPSFFALPIAGTAEYRVRFGRVFLDSGVALGFMPYHVSIFPSESGTTPYARAMATLSVPFAERLELVARLQLSTTFRNVETGRTVTPVDGGSWGTSFGVRAALF